VRSEDERALEDATDARFSTFLRTTKTGHSVAFFEPHRDLFPAERRGFLTDHFPTAAKSIWSSM
jgi:hypothetical protein